MWAELVSAQLHLPSCLFISNLSLCSFRATWTNYCKVNHQSNLPKKNQLLLQHLVPSEVSTAALSKDDCMFKNQYQASKHCKLSTERSFCYICPPFCTRGGADRVEPGFSLGICRADQGSPSDGKLGIKWQHPTWARLGKSWKTEKVKWRAKLPSS